MPVPRWNASIHGSGSAANDGYYRSRSRFDPLPGGLVLAGAILSVELSGVPIRIGAWQSPGAHEPGNGSVHRFRRKRDTADTRLRDRADTPRIAEATTGP